MVFRQFFRHVVGIESTSNYPTKDLAMNEISMRYVKIEDVHIPDKWRKQATINKQGSEGLIKKQAMAHKIYKKYLRSQKKAYNALLDLDVAKEQARLTLGFGTYTEAWWTASFQAIANLLDLRLDDHAQWEIKEYAKIIETIMLELFPVTMGEWFGAN